MIKGTKNIIQDFSPAIHYLAVGIGIISVLASLFLFYSASEKSFKIAEKNLYHVYSDKAELLESIIEINRTLPDDEILSIIDTVYHSLKDKAADEYVCIVNKNNKLVLHTIFPDSIGQDVSKNAIHGEKSCTLGNLVEEKTGYTGEYISSQGEEQIAAFVYVESRNWLLGVYRSKSAFRNDIYAQFRWIIITFSLIFFLLLPLSLGLLFITTRRIHKKNIGTERSNQEILKIKNQELKEAMDRVEISEAKFKTAYYTSPDAVNINKLDGEYVEINEGFIKLTGYTRKDVYGKKSSEIKIWANPTDRKILIQTLKQKGKIENLEAVFRCKDGSLKTALMSASIININDQPHILSVTRDITERKVMENELVAAKDEAEESNRLITAFLQNMSHEIRTPMNAIVGFSGMINRPGLTDEKRKEYSSIIQKSSRQLLSIVDDILTISAIDSRKEKVNISEVALNAILNDLVTIFNPEIQNKGVILKSSPGFTDNESTVLTDGTKLNQVLSNLLTNSIKFTEKGIIEIGYTPNGKNIEFFVQDTGIGIPKDKHQLIFERFRQADVSISENFGGTGLGLAISKAFVELMGGEIRVESEPGAGTIFLFTIPYYPVSVPKVS